MEELGRILLQKEGEPAKDSVIQARAPAGGKRAIGKAVAKGGLLLKGKNPGNVPSPSILWPRNENSLILPTDSTPGRRYPCSGAVVFPSLPQVGAGNARSTTGIFQLPTSSDTPCQCPQNRALPHFLISTCLGFERVRRRNRSRNTIPPHALRFLV